MLFWVLLASGQIVMRKVDGWKTLAEKPSDQLSTSSHDPIISDRWRSPQANFNTRCDATRRRSANGITRRTTRKTPPDHSTGGPRGWGSNISGASWAARGGRGGGEEGDEGNQ